MSDAEFVKSSVIETLVPEESAVDIEDIFKSAVEKDESALISSISQRSLLFFDEILPVYVVLRTPYNDERSLKERLPRFTITLEAHAVSSPSIATPTGDRPSSSGSQPRDVVWAGKVDVSEDPFTVVAGSAEGEKRQDVLLTWKVLAVLGRPRIRLQAPAILFKVSASLQPAQQNRTGRSEPYLPDGVPLPYNILQPLEKDRSLDGVIPQLSTLRFSRRSAIGEATHHEVLPIKVTSRKPFRAIPALSSRIRFHRSPFRVGSPSLVAALELEIPAFAQSPIEIANASLKLANGTISDLNDKEKQRLPIICHPRDSVVRLYSIFPNEGPIGAPPTNATQVLEVTINVRVLVSEMCRPNIEIRFKTNVDFPTPGNLGHGRSSRPIQRTTNPSNIIPTAGVLPGQTHQGQPSQGVSEPPSEKNMGIVFQFSARNEVHVGKPFKWEIFVINRSPRQRKLGLTMLSKRKGSGEKRLSSRPSSTDTMAANKMGSVADAFVDDNLLYTMIKSQTPDSTQLICLNSDLRIGPLNPGACFTTEMEFLPLAKGFLHMEGIRVSDLSTNESVDIRDLPDIIALEA